MKVRFYNFPKELVSEFSNQITFYYVKATSLNVIYLENDSNINRQKLRSILQKIKKPAILVSPDVKLAELCWHININQFVVLKNTLSLESFKEIQEGIKLCLYRNDYYLKKIAVNSQEGISSIALNQISYILADGSYSKIVTNQNEILVSKKLKYFQESLCELPNFHRFGRSLIVNLNLVTSVKDREVKFENGVTVSFPKSGNSFKELKELLLWKKININN